MIGSTTIHAPARPACPRCDKPTGLLLERPSPDAYHPIYRCDGRRQGCGYLWSPRLTQ
ncbi:MAG: hypothetical protein O6913_11960 [Chloroflexi bacterium]|nr:hypothetical protein [Chloroflexota bacterium]